TNELRGRAARIAVFGEGFDALMAIAIAATFLRLYGRGLGYRDSNSNVFLFAQRINTNPHLFCDSGLCRRRTKHMVSSIHPLHSALEAIWARRAATFPFERP